MELPAMEFEQNHKKLYITLFDAKFLSKNGRTKTEEWRSDNPDGYQRRPTDSRIISFSKFVENGDISPLSVLLSVRTKIKFQKDSNGFGKIILPDNTTFWQVDGQHRVEGLKFLCEKTDKFDSFVVPVVLFSSIDLNGENEIKDPKYFEAYQFYTINRTQKGVRSDLAERFLAKIVKEEGLETTMNLPPSLRRGIEWIPAAIEIAEILNQGDSVWQGKIRLPNETKGSTTVSQKSFTDSIKPIITHQNFKQYTAMEIAELLKRYWDAIKELMPEAFADPKEHVIQKITGPFVLHNIFPAVAGYCDDKVLSKENFKKVLQKMGDGMTAKFWHKDGTAGITGTNRKSFSILEKILMDKLNKNMKPSEKPFRPYKI